MVLLEGALAQRHDAVVELAALGRVNLLLAHLLAE
jgi:hypothetical protein